MLLSIVVLMVAHAVVSLLLLVSKLVLAVAQDGQLKWLRDSLQAHYELKAHILGYDTGDVSEVTFLGRTITLMPDEKQDSQPSLM